MSQDARIEADIASSEGETKEAGVDEPLFGPEIGSATLRIHEGNGEWAEQYVEPGGSAIISDDQSNPIVIVELHGE